jgi:uncharacterized protein
MKIGYEIYKAYIDAFCERLKASFGEGVILSIALFGSVARGQARPDSDIDLLVVHKVVDFNPTRCAVAVSFELEAEDVYQRLVKQSLSPQPMCVFLTEDELWERPHILLDILVEGIILHDTGILQTRFEALRKRLSELGSRRVTLSDGTWYWDLKPDWKPGEVIRL